jgi:glycosyltransferase involved in cell wall biosynthesis
LPIILSDRVTVLERVTGNGLTYLEGDTADLAERIQSLASAASRRQLGTAGSLKMRTRFSWLQIAEKRAADYARSLGACRVEDASGSANGERKAEDVD